MAVSQPLAEITFRNEDGEEETVRASDTVDISVDTTIHGGYWVSRFAPPSLQYIPGKDMVRLVRA